MLTDTESAHSLFYLEAYVTTPPNIVDAHQDNDRPITADVAEESAHNHTTTKELALSPPAPSHADDIQSTSDSEDEAALRVAAYLEVIVHNEVSVDLHTQTECSSTSIADHRSHGH